MDELLVMSELKHPNVVEFLGACMEPPKCFFAAGGAARGVLRRPFNMSGPTFRKRTHARLSVRPER